jgi:hypothetical protein
MGALRNLVVKVTGDTKGLQTSLSRAQRSVNSFSAGVQKSFSMGKLAAGLAVAGAAIYGIKSAMDATMPAYAEAKEAETMLATIMRQRMGATDGTIASTMDLANELQKTGVVEGDAIIAGQQQLATFLRQSDALKVLTPALANLVAQQKGVNATSGDATTIANMFGKAMDGNAGALKKVGVSLTDAQAKVLKTGNEMQRASMLAEIITANVGNMNEALGNTNIGRIAQLNNAWGDLKEQVGQAFTNLLAAAAPALMRVIDAISQALNYVIGLTMYIQELSGAQAEQSNTSKDVAKSTKGAAKSMNALDKATGGAAKSAQKWLSSFDQINKISKANSGGGGGVNVIDELELPAGGLGDLLTPELEKIKQQWANFWSGWGVSYESIKTWWDNMWDSVGYLLGIPEGTFDNLWSDWWEGIKLIFGDPAKAQEAWKQVIDDWWANWKIGIEKILQTDTGKFVVNALVNVGLAFLFPELRNALLIFDQLWNKLNWKSFDWAVALSAVVKVALSFAIPTEIKIFAHLKKLWDSLFGGGNKSPAANSMTATNATSGAPKNIGSIAVSVTPLIKFAFTAWANIVKALGDAWTKLTDGKALPTKSLDMNLNWKVVFGSMSSGWDAIVKNAKISINKVIDIVNGFITEINKIGFKLPDWLGGASFHFNVPKMPKFFIPSEKMEMATGGIVNSPTNAIIGEAGAEAVMPLENNTGWMDIFANKVAAAVGGGTSYGMGDRLTLSIGGEQFEAFITRSRARQSTRSNGR